MIEIRVPKEIMDFKEKFLLGLTVRQFIFAAVTMAVCVPLYIIGKNYMPEDILSFIVILAALPLLAFGFFNYNSMTFEKFLQNFFRQTFVEPQKRKYNELPVFWYARAEIISDEIDRQLAEFKTRR